MHFLKYFLAAVLIIFAVFVIYSKFKVSYSDVIQLLREANKNILLILLLLQGFCYFADGWLSQIIFKIADSKVSLKETIKIAILGVLGGQFVPVFGGAAASYYFFKKINIPSDKIVFLVSVWTGFVWFNYFFFFLVALFVLPKSFLYLFGQKIILSFLLFLFIIFLVYFLLKNQGKNFIVFLRYLIQLINKISHFFGERSLINYELPQKFVSNIFGNIKFLLSNKKDGFLALIVSTLFYFSGILTLYFSFRAFNFSPNFALLIFGFTISSIVSLITFLPGAPGVMDASLMVAFVALGFPAHITLFAVLLYRLFSYWLPLFIGIPFFFKSKNAYAKPLP